MVPPAVFFLFMATCFGYGWDSALEDNYPSTTDHSWTIGSEEESIILNPNPSWRPFRLKYFEPVRTCLRKMAENDLDSERVFYFFNQATHMRTIIDSVFYSWNQYKKKIALGDNYTKGFEEQATIEENHEFKGFSRSAYEVTESGLYAFDDSVATEAATAEMESSYNDRAPNRTGGFLIRLIEATSETVHSSTLPEDSIASASKKEYSFVTKLKIDRGTPGVDYPDYNDIPVTSFSCSDKTLIPGFYADLESGCQVFHACWSDRRESLLCPVGTIFDQTLMKCDYWYNSNCSLAPHFFYLNIQFLKETSNTDNKQSPTPNEYSTPSEATKPSEASKDASASAETGQSGKGFDKIELGTEDWNQITDFLPIKAKLTVYSKSGELEMEPAPDVPLPLRSALKSKQVLAVEEKARKIQVASRIVEGALGLAERVSKETAKFVMEIVKYRAKSEETVQKAEAAAKIVDEATDLAAKVAKYTARLVNRITLEALMHQAEKSADISTDMKHQFEVQHQFSTTPKTTQQKSLEVNPRFVVKPVAAPVDQALKQIQQLNLHGKNDAKEHVLEIIDKAFEMVLSVDIYPATRQVLLENYVRVALSKKH